MYFRTLDALTHVSGVYTLCWRFKDGGLDPWTQRVNAFKAGDSRAVRGACRVSAAALRSLNWTSFAPVGVTCAISSGETSLRAGQPLHVLGESVARTLGWRWLPDLLSKQVHRSLHSIPNAVERDQAVDGAYAAGPAAGLKTLILLDDFCTRGSTLSDAGRAIKSSNPGLVLFGFALGKAETIAFAAQNGVTIGNDHVPVEWAELWDNA